MKKKILSIIFAFTFVITSFAFCLTAFGSDVEWSYDSNTKTLTIFGSGDMDNYSSAYSAPWGTYVSLINNVIVEDGITSAGSNAFANMVNLSSVVLADSVTKIEANAFASDPSLKLLQFGSNIKSIGDSSFAYNGPNKKTDFALSTEYGSFALWFARENDIDFTSTQIKCGSYTARIYRTDGGTDAIFPYTPKYSGTYTFSTKTNYMISLVVFDRDFNKITSQEESNVSVTCSLTAGETYYFSLHNYLLVNCSFPVELKPESVTLIGTVKALLNPNGDVSDTVLYDATVDDAPVGQSFTIDFDSDITSVTKTFAYGNQSKQITFTPDSDSTVTFIPCDANSDGYINAKDYAILRKQNHYTLPLFKNFINTSIPK